MDSRPSVEAMALGILLSAPDYWPEAADGLTRDHYAQDRHRNLWDLLVQMQADGSGWKTCIEPINRAEEEGTLEGMGGIAYVSSLPELPPSIEMLPWCIQELEKERQRRALRDIDVKLRSAGTSDPAELRAVVEAGLRDLSKGEAGGWLDGMALAMAGEKDLCVNPVDDPHVGGWSWGLGFLDRMVGRLSPKRPYTAIGATPGTGKSALALQVVVHSAMKEGKVCAVVSLDMPAATYRDRLACVLSGVPMGAIRDGRLTRDQKGQMLEAFDTMARLPVYVDDRSCTPTTLRARLMGLAQRVGKVDLVVLDYLQRVRRDKGSRYGSRAEEIGDASHQVLDCFREMGCAGIVIVSLNRGANARDEPPQMEDAKESGDIEFDADSVVMLHRPGARDPNHPKPQMLQAAVRKARHGTCGVAECTWDGDKQTIREVETRWT